MLFEWANVLDRPESIWLEAIDRLVACYKHFMLDRSKPHPRVKVYKNIYRCNLCGTSGAGEMWGDMVKA
jgi:hypothetical protein